MEIFKKTFGVTKNGHSVTTWTMVSDSGCTVEILDYGCTIRSLLVPDAQGVMTDVVLGYNDQSDYETYTNFFGATVGRFANRIAGGHFVLGKKEYTLAVNNGPNHLHGGLQGFDRKMWNVSVLEDGLQFTLTSPDGEEGYPGTMQVREKIVWQDNAALRIEYEASTDQDTIVNLTNHSYFNLAGKGSINDHILQIFADRYNENDEHCLPTGALLAVDGVMDFRTPKVIGNFPYDHNYLLTSGNPAAVLRCLENGIEMTVSTDQPGIQFYAGGTITPFVCKNGQQHGARSALCLETQHYPDSIHHPEWPSVLLRAGEKFRSFTTFAFRTI